MILHITEANYLSGHKLSVAINNGKNGIADLSSVIFSGAFQALNSEENFAKVGLDKELETVVLPGGLDLAPEFVYFQVFKDTPPHTAQLHDKFKAWGYVS